MRRFPTELSFSPLQFPPIMRETRKAPEIDRASARAMVDAGYMTLRDYLDQFGFEPPGEGEVIDAGAYTVNLH